MSCPACARGPITPILRRTQIPVNQNLPAESREAAASIPRGDLDLRRCGGCGLLFNAAFREELVSYGEAYENTQSASPMFSDYLDQLVDRLVASGLRGKHIVEIGCGKGDFLRRLCRAGGNTGVGYDTSYVGPDTDLGGRVRFVKAYYGGPNAEQSDAVVCRHVIEHVEHPVRFLASLRAAFGNDKGRRLYLETPALEWIVKGRVWWDLFYEHCCYFTEPALRNMLRLSGFRPIATERLFDGQYQWLEGRLADQPEPLEGEDAQIAVETLREIDGQSLERWRAELGVRSNQGGVAIWGAGAKGVTFVNLIDPTAAMLRFVVDINPAKQGRFVAGSAHQIVSPSALASGDVRDVYVMNPNYIPESMKILRSLGINGIQLHRAEAA
jgi:SAM-dependent methyltransferase